MRISRLLQISVVLVILSGSVMAWQIAGGHRSTDWELQPSLKYDSLCLLNVLSGDPYYMTYYKAEFEHFNPLFTAPERTSFQKLKTILKDESGGIISATLALYFSVTPDETLEEMIATTRDPAHMRAALMKTPYWDAEGWGQFEKARPDLETALKALRRVGFPAYWGQNARPRIEKRIAELKQELPKYNVVPAIEQRLGHPLSSDRITIYLLAYSEPHGIKITGTRFITHESYLFRIVLHNAVHEMMHPPYNANDPVIAASIEQLGRDPVILDKVEHHDKSFGYNTVPAYVEEDSVQALEEIVCEQFGIQRDSREYWKSQDDGIHVLAVAIYVQYQRALQSQSALAYPAWLVEAVKAGNLQGAKLSEATREFFGK